jgi:hypothetical protein
LTASLGFCLHPMYTLLALYGDGSRNHELTSQVLGSCNAETVKVLMALSYEPDRGLLTKCATSSIASKNWKDAASLVVRFQLPSAAFLPWLTRALNSSVPEEFLAGADIISGGIAYRPKNQFNIGLKGSGLQLLYPQTVRSQLDLDLAMTARGG